MFFQVGPLSARFKDFSLYENVWLTLEENDFVLLKGPSGCGKSTLLRQCVGLFPGKGITRILDGRSFSPRELPLFRRSCLLLLSDAPMMAGSIEENLRFPFKHRLAPKDFDPEEARAWCERLGLAHLSWQKPAYQLSLGERHRLALVRAFLWDPKVILADEPFTGLDEKNFRQAQEALREFSQRPGKALLCVTHEPIAGVKRLLSFSKGRLKEEP